MESRTGTLAMETRLLGTLMLSLRAQGVVVSNVLHLLLGMPTYDAK